MEKLSSAIEQAKEHQKAKVKENPIPKSSKDNIESYADMKAADNEAYFVGERIEAASGPQGRLNPQEGKREDL